MSKKIIVAASITLTLFINMSLYAAFEVFQIDFGFTASPANWNMVNTIGTFDNGGLGLIDFNTGANVDETSVTSNFESGTGGPLSNPPFTDWVNPAGPVGDGIAFTGGTVDITVSGLAESSYTIEVVSAIDAVGSLTVLPTVEGNIADRDFLTSDADLTNWDILAAGTSGNWLIWDDVNPVGGEIDISVANGSFNGFISALRIADNSVPSVPEPSTYVMFGIMILGAGLMALRNRKKEKKEGISL